MVEKYQENEPLLEAGINDGYQLLNTEHENLYT